MSGWLGRSRKTNEIFTEHLPADGTLAVGRSLGNGQRLAHLGLCEAQREPAQLEGLGKLLDVVQVDSVDDVAVRLVDCKFIC